MTTIHFLQPEGLFRGNFSHVAKVQGGTTIYVSGQVAFDEEGKVAGSTFAEQTEKVFDNLERALAGAGARLANIVKMNIYLRDLTCEKVRIFREIRAARLGEHKPASTLVATPALVHEDLMLEIEVVAVLP